MTSVINRSDTPHKKSTLPNGIQVITERIPHIHSITLGVWVWSGSRFENRENHGIAHFLEHMLFKGTTVRNAFEIARAIESKGGYLNAFTGRELNCYFVRVLKDADKISIDLLADILQNSLFDPQEIEKEKGVVIDEIHGMEDAPEELVLDNLTQIVWQPHAISRSILGTEASVATFDDTHLKTYLSDHYVAGQVYIIASGAVDHDRLVKLSEAAFDLPTGPDASPLTPVIPPASSISLTTRDISQGHLAIGGIGLPYRDRNKYALYVLNTILGGGMTSRLFQNIREEKGLAYAIFSDLDFYYDTGLFSIYAGTDVSDVPEVLDAIFDECKKMRENLVRDEELEDAKSQLIGGLLLSLESTSNIMNRLARMEIYLDSYDSIEAAIASVEQVTTQEVIDLAAEILAPERLSISAVGPLTQDAIGKPL